MEFACWIDELARGDRDAVGRRVWWKIAAAASGRAGTCVALRHTRPENSAYRDALQQCGIVHSPKRIALAYAVPHASG
jgi:hypothetical protein